MFITSTCEDKEVFFARCLVKCVPIKSDKIKTVFFQAYARREHIEYKSTTLFSCCCDALENAKQKALEWECHNHDKPVILVTIHGGKIICKNQEATALTDKKVGDRFLVFEDNDFKIGDSIDVNGLTVTRVTLSLAMVTDGLLSLLGSEL